MSSDEEIYKKKKKSKDSEKYTEKEAYQIKPDKTSHKLDTSSWPLLLKVKLKYLISSLLTLLL